MLVIRLARTGRNKYPTYRIVAAESSRPATGKFVSILGHYNPHTKELVIKKDETVKYIGNGAQPSNTVLKLLQREKIDLPKWAQVATKNKKSKQEPVEEKPKAAEAPAEEAGVKDTPAEAVDQPEERVESAAEANNETVTEAIAQSAPEDTAAGEEAQAKTTQVVEAAGDVAIEEAADEAKVSE